MGSHEADGLFISIEGKAENYDIGPEKVHRMWRND